MKRVYKFAELSADLQREAIRLVNRIAERRAAYSGEIWIESGRELAALAKFTLTKSGAIWNAEFHRYPTVRPGSEFGRSVTPSRRGTPSNFPHLPA